MHRPTQNDSYKVTMLKTATLKQDLVKSCFRNVPDTKLLTSNQLTFQRKFKSFQERFALTSAPTAFTLWE